MNGIHQWSRDVARNHSYGDIILPSRAIVKKHRRTSSKGHCKRLGRRERPFLPPAQYRQNRIYLKSNSLKNSPSDALGESKVWLNDFLRWRGSRCLVAIYPATLTMQLISPIFCLVSGLGFAIGPFNLSFV